MKRRILKAKVLLCVLLTVSLHYFAGCGGALSPNPDEGIIIPLTPDHPVAIALAGSQFADAKAIIVFPSTLSFRLIFPDQSRQMGGGFTGKGTSLAMARFDFAKDALSTSMQLNPITKQVINISASNGFNWRPVHVLTAAPVIGNTKEAYLAANADLIVVEQQTTAPAQSPTTGDPPPTGQPNLPAPKNSAALPFLGLGVVGLLFAGISSVLVITLILILIAAILDAINQNASPGNNGAGGGDGTPNPDPNPGGGGDNQSPPTSPLLPNARADSVTTPEDTPKVIDALANDDDPDGTLNASGVTVTIAPAHGAALVSPSTGAVTYTPALNFNGNDAFTYSVCDNGAPQNCATAIVTITVTPVNDPPFVVTPIPDQNVPVGGNLSLNVAANFADPDAGDTITITASLVESRGTLPGWLNFDGGTAQFTGGPLYANRGTITIAVTATDGSNASVTDEFTINVSPGSLFTIGNDVVDFANIGAASYIDGFQYDALAGDDTITLPADAAAATAAGYDPSNVFHGGPGTDQIQGGDLNDQINGDADDDVIFGSDGDDTLMGGTGLNLLDYSLVSGPITVDLSMGLAFKAFGAMGTDDVSEFNNLTGTPAADFLIGNNNANVISGGLGMDILDGGGGNDTLNGGDGNDVLKGLAGDDVLDGGADFDRAFFQGGVFEYNFARIPAGLQAADTFPLRDGTDTLISIEAIDFSASGLVLNIFAGTEGTDVIGGAGGDDLVLGLGGDDTLLGSNGADYLLGGGGVNTLDYSTVIGPMTVDLQFQTTLKAFAPFSLDAFRNIQNVIGSTAADTLDGDDNNNVITGGVGIDQISGRGGEDTLNGGNDADTLFGNAGNDTLNGDAANDVLIGGEGDDALNGDGGTDRAVHAGAVLEYAYALDPAGLRITDTTPMRDGSDLLYAIEKLEFTSGGILNLITGTEAVDNLAGTAANDLALAFGSDDVVNGSDGSDYLIGGAGVNTLSYASLLGPVTVDLQAQTTTKGFGTMGTDVLRNFTNLMGSMGNDTLSGDAVDNKFEAGPGIDIIDGRGGVDWALYHGQWYEYAFSLGMDGLHVTDSNAARDGDQAITDIERVVFPPNSAYDLLPGTNNVDNLVGGPSNELILGLDGDDMLTGGGDDDILIGGANTDQAKYEGAPLEYNYSFENGAVRVADTVGARDGSDLLSSIERLNFLTGGIYNLAAGTNNADTVPSSSGNDLILGFEGDDTLLGSDGSDIIIGASGSNTVSYINATGVVIIDLNAGTTEKFFGTFGTDQLRDIQNATGSPNGDTLSGDMLPNILNGGGGNDILRGREDGDTLNGGEDNDTLFGDIGNDILNGDAGDDTLVGFAGDDVLDGGSNTDTGFYQGNWYDYSFSLDPAGMRITDSNFARDGSDVMTNIETLFFAASGQFSLVLGTDGIDNLTGGAFDDLLLGFSGTDAMNGGNGNDILIGGPNDDTMTGGSGADTFAFYLGGTNIAPGTDVVTDYTLGPAGDSLRFIGVADFSGNSIIDVADLDAIAAFSIVGADLRIAFAGGGSITLTGFGASGITSFATLITAGGQVFVSP